MKKIKRINKEEPFGRVRQIGGNYVNVDSASIVGYCHNPLHKGILTITTMNGHDCIKKECHYFERFEDYQFWIRLRRKESIKELNKEKRRLKKEVEERRLEKVKKAEDEMMTRAKQIAEELGYNNMDIISIHRTYPGCTIFYISDKAENDWYEFRELAFAMSREYHNKFILKHIKKPDGTYYVR